MSPKPYQDELSEWELPSISMLGDPEYSFGSQQEAMVREKALILERTLHEYRIDAKMVEIDAGPVIKMFEVQAAAGVKVSQIASLSNEIARALWASSVRVVAPIPGKNTIGVEVPNIDEVIVLASSNKLGHHSMNRLADLSRADYLITTAELHTKMRTKLEQGNVQIIQVS